MAIELVIINIVLSKNLKYLIKFIYRLIMEMKNENERNKNLGHNASLTISHSDSVLGSLVGSGFP